jgi:hypothetical protein
MRNFFINRLFVGQLLAVLLLPLLSGCIRGFFGCGKNALTPGTSEITAIPNKDKTVKDLPAEQPAQEKKMTKPFPLVEEKLYPPQLIPQNPESLMPLSTIDTGPVSESLQVLASREATAKPPDFFYHDAMLTEDTAWHGEVLIDGGVTIAPQTTLTVQSGTVVRFQGSAGGGVHAVLVVQGRIVVNGTVDKPITFTSLYRDAASAGWQGIVLLASEKKNLIENCRIEGAETGFDASFSTVTLKNAFFSKCRTGARLQESFAVMTGGGAGECGAGMLLYDCETDIRSADFFGNRLGIFATGTSLSLADSRFTGNNLLALTADTCRLNIMGNSFTANGSGLSLAGCEGNVSANRISKNAAYGIALANSRVRVNANVIEQNARIGLRIEDGKGIAWGNAISANGDYDIYNAGTDVFRAIGNWWGSTIADVAGRIYDQRMDAGRGRVLYFPVLRERPDPVAP